MQKRIAGRKLELLPISVIAVIFMMLVVLSVVTADAENSINLECPVFAPEGSTDSVGVRVFLANDSNLANWTLSFRLDTDKYVFSSATPAPSITQPPICLFIWRVFGWGRQIAVAGAVPTDMAYYPSRPTPVHVFTLWFQTVGPYDGECIDIDTCYIDPGCYTQFMIYKTHRLMHPDFNDCDSCEIVADFIVCGDLNGSEQMDIADVVYLVNYIFDGGPAPQDISQGDVDCSGQTNIADAVYLVNYIFGGGGAPCASCP